MNAQRRPTVLATAVPAVLLAACSGSGEGLDENGRPFDDVSAPLTAEFAAIQARVFTPYCTGCHQGAAAPVGLRLTADVSYASLVNAPAVERPQLRRVLPGNPDASYLVHKITGTAAVGARMPLGGPPLPQDAIDTIRQWILDGAAPPPAAPAALSALAPAATQLTLVFPEREAFVDFQLDGLDESMRGAIVLSANGELDASTLLPQALTLLRSGGDGSFGEGNELALAPLRIELRSATPTVFAVLPPGPWIPDRYRLTVAGSGPLPLRDLETRIVDGDADGLPGGDLVLEFHVAPSGGPR